MEEDEEGLCDQGALPAGSGMTNGELSRLSIVCPDAPLPKLYLYNHRPKSKLLLIVFQHPANAQALHTVPKQNQTHCYKNESFVSPFILDSFHVLLIFKNCYHSSNIPVAAHQRKLHMSVLPMYCDVGGHLFEPSVACITFRCAYDGCQYQHG